MIKSIVAVGASLLLSTTVFAEPMASTSYRVSWDVLDGGGGNICDADLNNDGTINFGDLAQFKSVFFPNPYDPDADFNGDGCVNFGDLALLKFYFLSPPGPSGVAP